MTEFQLTSACHEAIDPVRSCLWLW